LTQLEEQKIVSSSLLLARQQSKRTLPNDPLISKQWHLKFASQSGAVAGTDVNIDTVWSYPTAAAGRRGRGIYVGIVDDGLETGHPDLAANVDTTIDKDWNGSDADPNPEGTGDTGDNHGTACAGNVAAVGNNGVGVSGTAPEAKLVGMRLISATAGDTAEAEAMTYCYTGTKIIHILSNSWGPADNGTSLEGPGTLTLAALKSAVETGRNGKGTIITWAGGNGGDLNDNSNYDGYANSIYTIAVGAFDSQSQQAYYSEPGANLVICAPSNGSSPALGITTVDRSGAVGYNTGSTSSEISDANYTQTFGGTSSATPTLSGIIALILEANPNLGWRDVQEIIMRSAKKVNPTDTDWKTPVAPDNINHNHKFGAGLIDATAAVNMAKTWVNLGTQQTVVSPPTSLSESIPDNNATGVIRSFDFSAINLRVEHITVKVSVGTVRTGQLEVTLTSPSGTVSRLAEKHSDTTNRYTGWTFMTVRNWGENSRGTWTLKVADRTSGTVGTLTAAEVTIYGTDAVPTNSPPSVTVIQPASGSYVLSGANVTLTATASDFTADGSTGSVSSVQFFQGATPLGIAALNSGSYTFNWNNPPAGNYSITAQATDSEGAVGVSAPVLFTVLAGNGSPVISSLSTTSASVGSFVVLTGSNFVDVSGVAFSGTPAPSFTVDSATQITAVVPSGAVTGFITVTNGFGSGASSSALTVTVLPVLISQIYGTGGSSGAIYKQDYIELYNRSASTQSLAGWSVQYASATGTTWASTALSGSIGAGQYYLVAMGTAGTTGSALPTPNVTGTSLMSATAGKVALVNSTAAISGANPSGTTGLQDLVGYGIAASGYEGIGPAPAQSATLAVFRAAGGATDTGDNATDFTTGTPNPRNAASVSVAPVISSSLAESGTVGVAFNYQITASSIPTSFIATGLPTGLSVNTTTGAITGAPAGAGTSNVSISATNGSGTGTAATLVITVSPSGGGVTNLLSEDFLSLTTGSESTPSTIEVTTALTANFPTSTKAFSAGGKVKLGSGTLPGSITSKTLDLSRNGGVFTVSFDVKGWTTIEGQIKVTVGSLAPQTVAYIATTSSTSYETKTLSFTGGQANSTVKIETTAKRAFIDNVIVATSSSSSTPTVSVSGTLAAVNTTYGTASSTPTSFTVSGSNLTERILITPPSGYEISQTVGGASEYAATQIVGAAGTVATKTIYVRLMATTPFGTYSGNVTCNSAGSAGATVATVASSVGKKQITISGLVGVDKLYNGTSATQITGTPIYVGLVNGDNLSVTGVPSASFSDKNVGVAKTVTISGFTDPNGNYSVTAPTVTATISPKEVVVVDLSAANKPYDGTLSGTLAGTANLLGVELVDQASVVLGGTPLVSFVSENAGAGIGLVVSGYVLGGAEAPNYQVIQPGGLSADISPRPATIQANDQSKTAGNLASFGAGQSGFTSQGLVAGEEISTVTLTVSGGAEADGAAGLYSITPSNPVGLAFGRFRAGNYAFTYINGTLTVVPTFANWAGEGVLMTPELLMKYAIGGATSASSPGERHETKLEGTVLSLTAIVRKDDTLTIIGQAVTNLGNYGNSSLITQVSGSAVGVSQDGVPAGCERQKFTMDAGSARQAFLRISVTK